MRDLLIHNQTLCLWFPVHAGMGRKGAHKGRPYVVFGQTGIVLPVESRVSWAGPGWSGFLLEGFYEGGDFGGLHLGGFVGAAVGVGLDELGADLGPVVAVDGTADCVEVVQGGFFVQVRVGVEIRVGIGVGWGGERHDEEAFGGRGAAEFEVVFAVLAVAEADAEPVGALLCAVGGEGAVFEVDVGGPAGVVYIPAAMVAAECGVLYWGGLGAGAGGGELLQVVEEIVEFGVELVDVLLDLDCPFGGIGRHFVSFLFGRRLRHSDAAWIGAAAGCACRGGRALVVGLGDRRSVFFWVLFGGRRWPVYG